MSAFSQNGWPANDVARTTSYKIAGTTRALRLVKGPAGELLAAIAAWLHANVEKMTPDQEADDWGYAERPIRGQNVQYDSHGNAINLSNHASGTAFDYNSTQHPLGVAGTWSSAERDKVNAKLNQLGGAVRWGDNYTRRKDGMHFEINVNDDAVGLSKINHALAVLKGAVPAHDVTAPTGHLISLAAIEYAANGGYFHIGQQTALEDAQIVAGWLRRLGIITDRDERVWGQFVRADNWLSAGAQYRGLVKKYQASRGLSVDGIVGPKTKAKFQSDLVHDNYRVVA